MEKRVFVRCEDHDVPMVITYPDDATGKYPAMLLLHGFMAWKEGDGYMFAIGADRLKNNGIVSARIDFCSMGENRCSREKYGMKTLLKEAEAAFVYLCQDEHVDASRVGICGHSLGGRVTFLSAHLPSKCLVALNGAVNVDTNLPMNYDKNFMEQNGYVLHRTSDGRVELLFKRFYQELEEVKSRELYSYRNPICVVVGTCDPTLPPAISYDFVKHCGMENVDLIEIEQANHTFNAKTKDNSRLLEMYDKLNLWLNVHLK